MTTVNKAPAAVPKTSGAPQDGKKPPTVTSPLAFWAIDPVFVDVVADEMADNAKRAQILRLIFLESVAIAVLVGILVLASPLIQPIYRYYAVNPEGQGLPLVALTMPNMTNQAILSWSTTSITEIMTIGFGDFDPKLVAQQKRFTEDGWKAFATAFVKQKVGESFRKSQLVLTTVPADTPVILWQGVNQSKVYQWVVQMPVVMTYATNNNVTRREQAIINLTIVRVPAERSPTGIAIEKWSIG